MHDVAIVKYEKPLESLRRAVDLVGGLGDVSRSSKVFIKPNLCLWHEGVNFPKYGILTTARLVEDIVVLLKEYGVEDITIAEGMIEIEKRPESTLQLLAKGMGLDLLAQRYGVKIIDVMRSSFAKVTAGDVTLSVNRDILDADYVINIPVLKSHSQTMVSLGIKNLKGLLNIASRKKCHNTDRAMDLNYHLARLPDILSPSLTIIDGIYTLERGPLYTGTAYRSDIIVASKDVISADKVGATLLGIAPQTVPHIARAADKNGRPVDLGDVNVRGEVDIKTALPPHQWEFEQNESGDLPLFFARAGIKGITQPQADNTMCTYCADFFLYVIMGVLMANNKDRPFDDIEVLHGKILEPTAGHKHTLLVGQCQVKKNSKHRLINHCVKIKGCPPSKKALQEAYRELGIELPDDFIEQMGRFSMTFMRKYAGKPEFNDAFYVVR
ncbi:MAG TPA: DUF362 domain-containing protein [Dehalococcoidia bacterium]|nr:DUF362 domain-containing protein [Dehalococcoidia bacterium]